MPYRGRFQLGQYVPLNVWCRNSTKTPAEPAQAPVAVIMSDSDPPGGQIAVIRLPIQDRFGVTGFFQYRLHLDGRFAVGQYRVVYQYVISSTGYGGEDSFEVVAGGDFDGQGLSMAYYRRPGANFLLSAHDSGRLIRKRNPRV